MQILFLLLSSLALSIAHAVYDNSKIVMNSPIHPWYAGGSKDLIVNFSKLDFDTRLLAQLKRHKEVTYPFVNLSGRLDNLASVNSDITNDKVTSSIKLLSGKIGVTSSVSPKVVGHIGWKVKYDKVSETGIFIDKAFISIDTLNTLKVISHVTMGNMGLPFGEYTSDLLSEPMLKSIGQLARNVIKVGYNINGIVKGSMYWTHGKQYGINLKYARLRRKGKLSLGASLINKHSFLLDNTPVEASTTATGFVSMSFKSIGIRTEVLGTLSEKVLGKRLIAGRVEGFYNFKLNRNFANLALGYEKLFNERISSQPAYRANLTFNTVFSKFNYGSIELKFEESVTNVKKLALGARIGSSF